MQYIRISATRERRGPRALRFLLLLAASLLPAASARSAPLPAPDTAVVQPTSNGAVRGFVIDARTRRPLQGARVRILEGDEDDRQEHKPPLTDAAGRFATSARIGRSWSKIDWVRVFTSLPVLLALRPQSALKQSRTVLATRLTVRVERDGYLPFEGEVSASRLDAGRFAVQLDDIWLAPVGSGLASFSPDNVRYERMESFTVEPAVARPGERVTITARARIPFERGGRYRVYFDSTAPSLIKTEQRLEPAGPPDPENGLTTFRRVVTLPRQPKALTTELSPWISLDYRELPVGWGFKALLQVARSDAEAGPAREVAAGYERLTKHDLGDAAQTLRRAAEAAPTYAPAFRYLGEAYEAMGRTGDAAAAYEKLVALQPEDLEVAWPRYAQALLDAGRSDTAARVLESLDQRSKRLPPPVALARARLFARRGNLRAADEQLARAGRRGRIPTAVQREIALRRAEEALRATPDSPDAELALARALADVDRLEEAARHARRAHSLRPDEPWPLIELGAMEQHLGRDDAARAVFQRALALDPVNGDAHFALGHLELRTGQYALARDHFRRAAERRPYDFGARHGLALAEYRAGDRAAAAQELAVAAVIGRGKGEMDAGLEVPFGPIVTLYFGPKRQTISGFNRQEAAEDYQLLRALERLARRPDDALAHLNAGTALARLGQADLALESLDRAAALRPDLADVAFWRGVALAGLGRAAEARRTLEEALRQNPLHPNAHRALARLCLESGDLEEAQAHLAAHRHNWPHEREHADTGPGVP